MTCFRIGIAHAKTKAARARQIEALAAMGIPESRVIWGAKGGNLPRLVVKLCRPGTCVTLLPGHGFSKHYLAAIRKAGAVINRA